MKRKQLIILLAVVILLAGTLYIIYANQEGNKKKYSLEDLQTMPDKELYQLLVDNGMRVHEDFINNLK